MKRIISLTLAVLMLVTLLLTATSCEVSMEAMTGYTQLRDHLSETAGDNKPVALDHQAVGLTSAMVSSVTLESGDPNNVCVVGYAKAGNYVLQLTLILNGSPEKARAYYEVLNAADGKAISTAYSTVLLTHYTGDELVAFESLEGITPVTELTNRQNASVLLNSILLALDTYITKNLDMNLHDLGFIALSDKYMADVEQAEVEEDLGGAFSSARLSKAVLMIVQGMGMVFLVLAILWLVLLIFKKVFYKDPAKEEKKSKPAKTEAPAPVAAPVVEAPVAVAPVADDGALIAAITAAIAATIESDPALTSQFAGGFRVVSFKRTEKSPRNR